LVFSIFDKDSKYEVSADFGQGRHRSFKLAGRPVP